MAQLQNHPRAMFAYYIHDLSPFIWNFGHGFGLRWYGLAYVLSFFIGYRLYRFLAERGYSELKAGQVSDFITWAAVFGVLVGGRIGWIIFYGLHQDHSGDPWWWPLEVWKGGMSSHGGILGLVLFTLWYARRHRLSWTSIGDSLCVVAPVGLFLVRVANFINGELYGKPAGPPGGHAAVPWAVIFPGELEDETPILSAIRHDEIVRDHLRQILPPRHPSQIYEALLEGVLLFSILWFMRTRLRVPRGVLTGAFFIFYAVLRIIGEVFRVPDSAWTMGALSAGQFLSLFLIVIGMAFVVWALRHPQFEHAQARAI